MEKGKYQVLLGSDLVLGNRNLYSPDSLDEMSDLSEFLGMSSSIKLTENSSEEEQVSLIFSSKEQLMARMKRAVQKSSEEPPKTVPITGKRGPWSEKTKKEMGEMSRKISTPVKRDRQRRWDPATTAAK